MRRLEHSYRLSIGFRMGIEHEHISQLRHIVRFCIDIQIDRLHQCICQLVDNIPKLVHSNILLSRGRLSKDFLVHILRFGIEKLSYKQHWRMG